MRKTCVLVNVVMTGIIGSAVATAQPPSQRSLDIAEISRRTAEICQTVQQRGSKSDKQLAGEVEAKLPEWLAKKFPLGGKINGQMSESDYEGLSQETVSAALQSSINCRQNVAIKLMDWWYRSSAVVVEPTPQQRTYDPIPTYRAPMTNDILSMPQFVPQMPNYAAPSWPSMLPPPSMSDGQKLQAMIRAQQDGAACMQQAWHGQSCHDLYVFASEECKSRNGDRRACELVSSLEMLGIRSFDV